MTKGGLLLASLAIQLMPRPFNALLAATMAIKRLQEAPPSATSAATIGALLMAVEGFLPYQLYTRWVVFELGLELKAAEGFRRQAHNQLAGFSRQGGFQYLDRASPHRPGGTPKRR